MDKLCDFDRFPVSDRNGAYGGRAGAKEGISIKGEYWMIKYPKSTKGMRGPLISYSTSPLSEYIGSHIYEILGYDVHQTLLGLRNGKVVVGCKDFCENYGDLREIRLLKNIYNSELESRLEESFSSTGDAHFTNLTELLLHFKYNPILNKVSGIRERFWDCVIIDGLINNNDRNNGNWGLLRKDSNFILAPVFDNGASFSSKLPDDYLEKRFHNEQSMHDSAVRTWSSYSVDNRNLSFNELLQYDNEDLRKSVKRVVPVVEKKMNEIFAMIDAIPETFDGVPVCSKIRKKFYKCSMQIRFDEVIKPEFIKVNGD